MLFLSLLLLVALFFPQSSHALDILDQFFFSHPGARPIFTSPATLISALLPNILILSGITLLLIIILIGFNYITAAGAGKSPQEISKIRSSLTYSILGFLLVVSAYFILQMVGTIIGIDFTNPNI